MNESNILKKSKACRQKERRLKKMFHVKKRTLLLIVGIVWLIAGFNVARLGVLSYFVIESQWYLYLFSTIVFVLFGTMFLKMSQKHTKRILNYEDYKPFWNFLLWTWLCISFSRSIVF